MPLLEIANTDRVITITPLGAWVPGNPTYTQNVSLKTKACGKGIIAGVISWIMAGCTFPPNVFVAGAGTIAPTAIKVTENFFSMKPIRKNDIGQCSGQFSFFGLLIPCSCTFQVTNAGQLKDKCN